MNIVTQNGYIVGYSQNAGHAVSDSNWAAIRSALGNRPSAAAGFQMMLKADTLEWGIVPLPVPQEEDHTPTAEEILNILLGSEET